MTDSIQQQQYDAREYLYANTIVPELAKAMDLLKGSGVDLHPSLPVNTLGREMYVILYPAVLRNDGSVLSCELELRVWADAKAIDVTCKERVNMGDSWMYGRSSSDRVDWWPNTEKRELSEVLRLMIPRFLEHIADPVMR